MSRRFHHIKILLTLTVCLLVCLLQGCAEGADSTPELDRAETLMDVRPDSALMVLDSIRQSGLTTKSLRARYALLRSQALDKNYIDTTSFAILQPALDFYLKKGTPEEKVKTLYYQARIYQNCQRPDSAMTCLLRGSELTGESYDYAANARLLYNLASELRLTGDFKEAKKWYLEAADQYAKAGNESDRFDCMTDNIELAFIMRDRHLADSVFALVREISGKNPELESQLYPYTVRYTCFFEPDSAKRLLQPGFVSPDSISDDFKIDLANWLCEFGQPQEGKRFFDAIDTLSDASSTLQYSALKPYVLKMNGEYAPALDAYMKLIEHHDQTYKTAFETDFLFEKDKYNIEKENLETQYRKNLIIWFSGAGCFILLLAGIALYYRYRASRNSNKRLRSEYDRSSRMLALSEQSNQSLAADNESLVKKNEALMIAKGQFLKRINDLNAGNNLQQQERMRLLKQITNLKDEVKDLNLLKKETDLSDESRKVIKRRLALLDNLLIERINSGSSDDLLSDREEFVNCNRLAISFTSPGFIAHLKEHAMTVEEINLLCLYAIGMPPKQAEHYFGNTKVYKINGIIRIKLKLEKKKEYLPAYIRNLYARF